jgi:hypothetical protein
VASSAPCSMSASTTWAAPSSSSEVARLRPMLLAPPASRAPWFR